jgi:hypothetical protein
LAGTILNLSALLIRARQMLVITILILGAQYGLSFAPFFNKLPITSRYIHGAAMVAVLLSFNLLVLGFLAGYLSEEKNQERVARFVGRMLAVANPMVGGALAAESFVLVGIAAPLPVAGFVAGLVLVVWLEFHPGGQRNSRR